MRILIFSSQYYFRCFRRVIMYDVFAAIAVHGQEPTARTLEAEANAAYRAGDFPVFLDRIRRAGILRPNHPRLLDNLAAAYALNGESVPAIETLSRLARMGLVFPVLDSENFVSLRGLPATDSVINQFRKNQEPILRSTREVTVAEKGIVPESVAVDTRTGTFYISSVAKRKIVKVDGKARHSIFADAAAGLWSVLGIKIDQKRRHLWAAVSAMAETPDLEKSEIGSAAVMKFDLKSGRLLKRFVLPNSPNRHVLGDLVLHPNGDVYATDSVSPAIYVVKSGRDSIEPFIEGSVFVSLQGIDLSADHSSLFVADYSSGIFRIDLETKKVSTVAPPPEATLLGIDGLYFHRNTLIGIQNGVNPQRIVRMYLSSDNQRIVRFEVLE